MQILHQKNIILHIQLEYPQPTFKLWLSYQFSSSKWWFLYIQISTSP
jgi:hypothetical protein